MIDQPQIGFVHKCGGRQGVVWALRRHSRGCQFSQLVVQERKQLIGSIWIALFDGRQNLGHVTHGGQNTAPAALVPSIRPRYRSPRAEGVFHRAGSVHQHTSQSAVGYSGRTHLRVQRFQRKCPFALPKSTFVACVWTLGSASPRRRLILTPPSFLKIADQRHGHHFRRHSDSTGHFSRVRRTMPPPHPIACWLEPLGSSGGSDFAELVRCRGLFHPSRQTRAATLFERCHQSWDQKVVSYGGVMSHPQ